jgi:hypothetical protein
MSPTHFSANSIKSYGSLLPRDVLAKIQFDADFEGMSNASFQLEDDVRTQDAITEAWNQCQDLWRTFRAEKQLLEAGDPGTELTRERWLVPMLKVLDFTPEFVSSIDVGSTTHPISHVSGETALHLLGCGVPLNKKTSGVPGASKMGPHSTLQQFLNRSDEHLWGIVSNGMTLHVLRDTVSLTRQAYVEFDLEAMFNGAVFSDFRLFYKICHSTRFEGAPQSECLLERWIVNARESGIRAMDQLREGVESALCKLGTGFIIHPQNKALQESLTSGDLMPTEMYRYLMRIVYRFLFLFTAEDRDVLLLADTPPHRRDRFEKYYSTSRLRELADRPTSPGHSDLWDGFLALASVFNKSGGEPALGLPELGSFLWEEQSIGLLADSQIDNAELLSALQDLAFIKEGDNQRRVDFAALGAEELGSIYESLLELHPVADTKHFSFVEGAGSERKTSGSYYTPTELITELLNSALDPILEIAIKSPNPEEAILDLNVVDPACGSGHFLVAAAHRMARHLATARTGEPEPSPEITRTALRDVIGSCIYGVDLNEFAVELCKVNLWLEAIEPGKPLSFLEHRIQHGNALFGATPAAIAKGIPGEVFEEGFGDTKEIVSALKKRNKHEHATGQTIFGDGGPVRHTGRELTSLDGIGDYKLSSIREKESLFKDWKNSANYGHAKLTADAWCASFVIGKNEDTPALTQAIFERIRHQNEIGGDLFKEIEGLAKKHRFFHWHLAFPQIFNLGDATKQPGWGGGFDVILGNPPWETVLLKDKEFFATKAPHIATASTASDRKILISALNANCPRLWQQYQFAKQEFAHFSLYLRKSGIYPFCSRGTANLYKIFIELSQNLITSTGRIGMIVPPGIATEKGSADFFKHVTSNKTLNSLYSFDEKSPYFKPVQMRFCLLTLSGTWAPCSKNSFVFYALSTKELLDESRNFSLESNEFSLINPNTETCPTFRNKEDARIVKAIYSQIAILKSIDVVTNTNWNPALSRHFDKSNASLLFRTSNQLLGDGWTQEGNRWLKEDSFFFPLYEGKMFWHFDHRWSTFSSEKFRPVTLDEKMSPSFLAQPEFWVSKKEVDKKVSSSQSYIYGSRLISNVANKRTLTYSALPISGVSNSILSEVTSQPSSSLSLHVADHSSFVHDYVARQKMGGTNINIFVFEQLPNLSPTQLFPVLKFEDHVTELTVTAWDMVTDDQPQPYIWNEERRALIRSELDALMFHLYKIDRDDVSYIMDTFPGVCKDDVKEFGEYKTKRLILECYDRMAEFEAAGKPYETLLNPPPADPSLRHSLTSRPDWANLYLQQGLA